MPTTRARSGELMLGGVRLDEIVRAPEIGTPTYVYDLDAMESAARRLEAAFDEERHLVAYAMKANSAAPIVRTLVDAGCGADVVSGPELTLALACGVPPDKIVYSGVAKTDEELAQALTAGATGIRAIQLESIEEIVRVEAVARALGRTARISLRLNPEVALDALDTHAHIATGHDEAKFGIAREQIGEAARAIAASSHLALVGMTSHVGSQLVSTEPYVLAARTLFSVTRDLMSSGLGSHLEFVDTGGGFGIDYDGSTQVAEPGEFVRAVRVEKRSAGLEALALHVEPGRVLVGAHGVLVARVIQPKVAGPRRWLMIDAGMNDLIRPALYQARHRVVPVEACAGPEADWRVVGPVCESSDDFGVHRMPVEPPRHVAILDAGAYGFTMASRYNGRALPSEVFLRGGRIFATKPRAPADVWVRDRLA